MFMNQTQTWTNISLATCSYQLYVLVKGWATPQDPVSPVWCIKTVGSQHAYRDIQGAEGGGRHSTQASVDNPLKQVSPNTSKVTELSSSVELDLTNRAGASDSFLESTTTRGETRPVDPLLNSHYVGIRARCHLVCSWTQRKLTLAG